MKWLLDVIVIAAIVGGLGLRTFATVRAARKRHVSVLEAHVKGWNEDPWLGLSPRRWIELLMLGCLVLMLIGVLT